jgi:ribosome-associated toxin RatA of RatAB toxin-antitoxin module
MPTVESSLMIAAAPAELFALSQDYGLRRAWDPFVRAMHFLDGATEAGVGVRVWARAWNGLTMEVRFTGFLPPRVVAMKMTRGPWLFRRFAGTWRFAAHGPDSTCVTFRYFFEVRPRCVAPLLEPIISWAFERDIQARLRGLRRGAEQDGLLRRLAQSCS